MIELISCLAIIAFVSRFSPKAGVTKDKDKETLNIEIQRIIERKQW